MRPKIVIIRVTVRVEISKSAIGRVWRFRDLAIVVVITPMNGMLNTHMEVSRASPMADLIKPISIFLSKKVECLNLGESFIFIERESTCERV
jgi:hypothetical protein